MNNLSRLITVFYLLFTIIHTCGTQDRDLVNQDSIELLFYDNDSSQVIYKHVNTENYGCLSSAGDLIIPFEYEYLGILKDGLRLAILDSKYGYFNKKGDIKIEFQYLGGNHFSYGKAIVINQEGFGVIDKDNQIRIPFGYGSLSTEDHRYYAFKKTGGKFGIMDSEEKVLVPEVYDNIMLQNDSIWIAMLNRKFEIYKYNGEKHLDIVFNNIGRASASGYAKVTVKGKKGMIDKHFNIVLPPIYKAVNTLFDNYIGAKDSLGWKVYNASQDVIIDEVFDNISYLNASHCIVHKDGRANIINLKGERILDPETKSVRKISGEKMLLHVDGYLYDGMSFKKIFPDRVDLLSRNSTLHKGLLAVRMQGKCAVIDTIGNIVIPPKHNYCEDMLSYGYLKVQDDNSDYWGMLNKDNELVIPMEYKDIYHSRGTYEDAAFWLEKETTRSFYDNQKILVSEIDSIVGFLGDFIFFMKKDEFGFINSYKNTVRMLEYDSIIVDRFPLIVIKDGKYGTLDYDGNLDITCHYNYLRAAGSYFIIKEGDKYGTLSKENKVLEPPRFDKIEKGRFDMFGRVFINDKIGLLDTEGMLLLPIEYDELDVKVNGQVIAKKADETFHFNCMELQLKAMDEVPAESRR